MSKLRILELFCGIGGLAEVVAERATIVAAVDIDRDALAVHQHNFPHPVCCRTIESLPVAFFEAHAADMWWLSPPCQPFTRKGRKRDLEDPRCAGLVTVIERIGQLRPNAVAIENVPEFAGSRAHGLLREALARDGYTIQESSLCPTQLGVPNRRRRFYLVAARSGTDLQDRMALSPQSLCGQTEMQPLIDFLDTSPDPTLAVDDDFIRRYQAAMHVVSADDPRVVTSCFTSAYGRSPVRSGSYLQAADGRVRRFSPAEIVRLLGFRPSFSWPAGITRERGWGLVGNSLSVPVVRWLLAGLLALPTDFAGPGLKCPASSSGPGGK
jgi:site-specific DNA-cytosine methylase